MSPTKRLWIIFRSSSVKLACLYRDLILRMNRTDEYATKHISVIQTYFLSFSGLDQFAVSLAGSNSFLPSYIYICLLFL